MEFAQDAAGKALVQSSKTVEACQAYLLLAVYPMHKKKYYEDRSWLFMGLAFRFIPSLVFHPGPSKLTRMLSHCNRLAIELNLCSPSLPGRLDEREQLNRMRTWLNCFCVDACSATQTGKMPMLEAEDCITRTSREWYRSSALNLAIDVHLVAHVEMQRVMGRFRKETESAPSSQKVRQFSMILWDLVT